MGEEEEIPSGAHQQVSFMRPRSARILLMTLDWEEAKSPHLTQSEEKVKGTVEEAKEETVYMEEKFPKTSTNSRDAEPPQLQGREWIQI